MKVRTWLFLFALLVSFVWPHSMVAQAESASYLQVDITSDKQSYSEKDEITYTLTIKNTSSNKAKDIIVTSTLPEGLEVLSKDVKQEKGKLVWEIDAIEAFGETAISFSAKATTAGSVAPPVSVDTDKDADTSGDEADNGTAPDSGTPANGEKAANHETAAANETAPQTGDDTNLIPYYLLLAVSVGVLLISVMSLRKKRLKKTITTMMIAALILPSFSVAKAEALTEKVSETHIITVNDKEYNLRVNIEGVVDVDTTLLLKVERKFGLPTLEWNAVEGATYKVNRGTQPNALALVEEITVNTYSDLNSTIENPYYYQVVAIKDGKEVYQSSVVLSEAYTDSDSDGIADQDESTYQTDAQKSDTDGDGLTDGEEVFAYHTDPLKKDTDGDRLTDGQEVNISTTDPLKVDTDENGTPDDAEDPDKDTISTYDEITLGSNPKLDDSDLDGLLDNEELSLKTSLIEEDTDQDGMLDGNEITYGTDPLNPDTDGNGIQDGQEVFAAAIETNDMEKDDKVFPSLQMGLKGENLGTVSISNVGAANPYLNENTPGYIGAPYEFRSQVEFDQAEMKFTLDPTVLNDPSIDPAIYYFNESTKLLELLPDQTLDRETGTITTTVEHFSTYMVLNKLEVDEVWAKEMKPPHAGNLDNIEMAIGFSLDSSGSMEWNDPEDLRKQTAKEFVDKLDENDKAAIIDFDWYATVECGLTNDKELIKQCIDNIDSYGGTDLEEGMKAAIGELEDSSANVKYIILLTDGMGYYDEDLTQQAKDLGIVVFTIGLGDELDEPLLRSIAEETGGKYYHAGTAEDLVDTFNEASEETIDLATDTDGDGLSDYHEKRKIRTSVGEIQTNVEELDTDGDSIPDGEELTFFYSGNNEGYFILNSNPLEKDSDFDTIPDNEDPNPMVYDITDRTLAIAAGLSYSNLKSNVGKKIDTLISDQYKFKRAESSMDEINDWSIIHANDSGDGSDMYTDNGLGSVAIKISRMGKPDAIIYGLRGTEDDDTLSDLVITDVVGYLSKYTPQSNDAYSEYKSLMKENPNADFYLAGHSLGGRIVQDVIFKTYTSFENIFNTSIKAPVFAATFNALGYNIEKYLKLDFVAVNLIKNKINNYYYEKDLVGEGLGDSLIAQRLGTDITPWAAKDKNGETITGNKYSYYIFSAAHGIDLWVNDPKLRYPEVNIINP